MSIRSPLSRVLLGAVLLGGAALAFSVARAASSGGSSSPSQPSSAPQSAESSKDEAQEMFDRGMQMVKDGDYEGARDRFEKAVKKKKDNADYVNMLAYTQRKTGNLPDAFENYEKALGLRPNFPQAREYLGEAHLQAALLQVDVLRKAGPSGTKELEMLTEAFRKAAATLQPEAMGAGTPSGVNPKEW